MLCCRPLVIGRSIGSTLSSAVNPGGFLPAGEQVVDLVVDEVAVALEILLVDLEASGVAEKPLEPRKARRTNRWLEVIDGSLRDHACSSPADPRSSHDSPRRS